MMRSSTGRWVTGDDFFGRDAELRALEPPILDGNHVFLTGERRIGKTSVARELGRRLEGRGWKFVFADIESAKCPEDVVVSIAAAAFPIWSAFRGAIERLGKLSENVEKIGMFGAFIKFRANKNEVKWQKKGDKVIRKCSKHRKKIIIVIDEFPVFLNRMIENNENICRIKEFLSWMRGAFQNIEGRSPVLLVSGSIDLELLVRRLGSPYHINYFHHFHLGPWSRDDCSECLERLAKSAGLSMDARAAAAVVDALGIRTPHHVQSTFARLHEFALMNNRSRVTTADVRTMLLEPPGQIDLVHHQTCRGGALPEEGTYSIAREISAGGAARERFTPDAWCRLEERYPELIYDWRDRIAEVSEVLEHDGYLEAGEGGHGFASRLQKDRRATRLPHHDALGERQPDIGSSGDLR